MISLHASYPGLSDGFFSGEVEKNLVFKSMGVGQVRGSAKKSGDTALREEWGGVTMGRGYQKKKRKQKSRCLRSRGR